MSIIGQNILAGASGAGGYEIEQSCRFNDDDSESLFQNFATDGNQKTWTFSAWVKRGNLQANKLSNQYPSIFETGSGNGNFRMYCPTGGTPANQGAFLTCGSESFAGQTNWSLVTQGTYGPVFRDPTGWYHLVFAMDTTQNTAADRLRIFVNGVKLVAADYSVATYPVQNDNTPFMGSNSTSGNHSIGLSASNSSYRWDGLFAEVHCTDGVANAADAFGEFDAITGQWVAKKYIGSYGTNGWYLKFEDSSDLGNDSSGLDNDFTVANLTASDQLLDTPTNNFCTLSTLVPSLSGPAIQLSSGNLTAYEATGSTWAGAMGTMGVSSGKWYWEMIVNTGGSTASYPGIIGDNNTTFPSNESNPQDGGSMMAYYGSTGDKRIDGSNTTYGDAYSAATVVGMALDLDSSPQTMQWYNANVGQGAVTLTGDITDADLIIPSASVYSSSDTYNFGQDSTFNGTKTAGNNADGNGKGDFFYAPPAGHLALCTDNLPTPAIKDPTKHFDVSLWTGNGTAIGSGGKTITGLEFNPDFIWAKSRDAAESFVNTDKLRGVTKVLHSDTSAIESTDAESITAFNSNGFTVGDNDALNTNTHNYWAWSWLAAGLSTGVTNNDGASTSYVSANPTAGFSVVLYTGTGSNTTMGHGLGVAPRLILVKSRGILNSAADDWRVQHRWMTNGNYILNLNTPEPQSSDASYFNGTLPAATVFSLGTQQHTNESGESFVAYCFAPVPGYSAMGKYYGNGSNDGPVVVTGFRPAATIIKRLTQSDNWPMHDYRRGAGQGTFNEIHKPQWADDPAAENVAAADDIDYNASGFKIRDSAVEVNADNELFVYYAVARWPFKYANAL